MCKKCGGVIEPAASSERGRFYIAVEKAVADLQLTEQVQEELWAILHSKASSWVRHSFQIASFNEQVRRRQAST